MAAVAAVAAEVEVEVAGEVEVEVAAAVEVEAAEAAETEGRGGASTGSRRGDAPTTVLRTRSNPPSAQRITCATVPLTSLVEVVPG